jgi:chromate reductase, NAD(P)H dehydrogenase (quinone)
VPVIVGIAGSLRRASFNRGLLRCATTTLPKGWTLELRPIREIPLYDADVEREQGIPAVVQQLKDDIAHARALWLCTPEYNHGVPGVLKNAIDWLSRPPGDIARVFGGKPLALSGVTPGQGGTRLSQAAWLPTLRALGVRLFSAGALHVSSASSKFDESGDVSDPQLRARIGEFAAAFVAFVEDSSG